MIDKDQIPDPGSPIRDAYERITKSGKYAEPAEEEPETTGELEAPPIKPS